MSLVCYPFIPLNISMRLGVAGSSYRRGRLSGECSHPDNNFMDEGGLKQRATLQIYCHWRFYNPCSTCD